MPRLTTCLICLYLIAGISIVTAEIPVADQEFFEKSVRPILAEHCQECHQADEISGGLRLDSKTGWMSGGDSGPAIVPGDPDASRLMAAVSYDDRDLQMPPRNKLADNQIAVLRAWILRGAPDPRVQTPQDAKGIIEASPGMSIQAGKSFWSMRPIGSPEPPRVSNSDWVQTPIDAFILAKLESQGLRPAPPADRRTLIRRITYDLTGLSPTQQEIDDFVADESPQAIQRVVERLLASPRYGVRWGRHWLDVARYADSNGLDENLAFGNAWRYRDYVVNAFNDDKPFDRFLVEQIAGDLLPDATNETKTATGFLVLGAKVLAEPDREKLEMDTIDEQIDVTGKVFLGMTLGCVRCHDHKFDPVKQTDYYALAAIFKSTRTFAESRTGAIKHWHEHVFADQHEVDAIASIDKLISQRKSAAASYKSQAISKLRQRTRAQAVEYLVAAAAFTPSATLNEITAIAEPSQLHPRVLHQCRLYLQHHPNEPFFAHWHQSTRAATKPEQAQAAIEQHYRPILKRLLEQRQKNPTARRLDDPELEAVRAIIDDNTGLLAVPAKPEYAFDAETLAEYDRLMEVARLFESDAGDLTAAMGVSDQAIVNQLAIHIRGSHLNLGEPVSRAFPEVMRFSPVPPIFPTHQSGRLELAHWMADSRHPLTARVYVNRLWRWHFGEGIVRTTENFGALGDRPSHPDLLDWLTRYFIASGWSTKEIHRMILASNTYQMASRHENPQRELAVDPDNRMWWKFRNERLQPEAIRDSILALSGQLDEAIGGKTVPLRNRQFVFNHTSVDHTKYDSVRRAIYLPVIRNNLYTFFAQYDYPDPTMPTGDRSATVVAPQALWMMNSDLVMDASERFADRLLEAASSDASRIESAYVQALGRTPTEAEKRRALSFIDQWSAVGRSDAATVDKSTTRRAWSLFCQSLMASNEFIYVK
ncbi:MAG: DUF1549 domain-containing protein [Rubripirellula sp.]|nr:DUF1549 domain-containing protein [Rubripirellula sp.]